MSGLNLEVQDCPCGGNVTVKWGGKSGRWESVSIRCNDCNMFSTVNASPNLGTLTDDDIELVKKAWSRGCDAYERQVIIPTLLDAIESARSFIVGEYRSVRAEALEGEPLDVIARPTFKKLCDALGVASRAGYSVFNVQSRIQEAAEEMGTIVMGDGQPAPADGDSFWQKQPGQKSWWERHTDETEESWNSRIQHARFIAFDPDNPDIPLD